MTYKSYHSNVKVAASTGFLPFEIEKNIPVSTLYRFKNTDYSKLYGYENSDKFLENISLLKELSKSRTTIKLFKAALRLRDIKISILTKLKNSNINIKKKIVSTINRVKDSIGIKKPLNFFNITSYKFYSWANQIKYICNDSILKQCYKITPHQLSKKEVKTMKSILENPDYKSWSITSLAWYSLKNNILSACVSTWYKYVGIMKINRSKPNSRRKKNKTGIRAKEINKIWHMDVTVFKTMDNIKSYIYILIDNFSRCIINYRVDLKLKASTTFDMLKESYFEHIAVDKKSGVDLITDGGPENNSLEINEFTNKPEISIQKLTALVDIDFSNSIVESYNKLLKYRFLYQRQFPDFNSLKKYLPEAVYEYNEIRPHFAHKYLTPKEVFDGQIYNPGRFKEQLKKAGRRRIIENKKEGCGIC